MTFDGSYPLARWGFVVLGSNLPLDDDLRQELLVMAIKAYMDDTPRVDFDWENASGRLTTDGDAAMLGAFVGQKFVAEIEIADSRGRVEFLVTEAQLRWASQAADQEHELLN